MTDIHHDPNTETKTDEVKTEAPSILPPFPIPLFPYTEVEKKLWADTPTEAKCSQDMRQTIGKKMFALWHLYGSIVNNKELVDIINEPSDNMEKDLHSCKNFLVQIVDQFAKVLSQGHVLQEIQHLQEKE